MSRGNADPQVQRLLKRALADPFGQDRRANVEHWLDALMRQFPLWAFQAWAYDELFPSRSVPSNYPLQVMINSIVEDEGMEPREWFQARGDRDALGIPRPVNAKMLSPLECALDRRRYELSWSGRFGSPAPSPPKRTDPYERLPLPKDRSHFNCVYPRTETEADYTDPEDPHNTPSCEKRLGREVLDRIEAWVTARDKQERDQADQVLDQWIKDTAANLGVPVRPGRFPEGPSASVLKRFYQTGSQLIEHVWGIDPEPTKRTIEVLGEYGVSDSADMQRWCKRLALPVFSQPEIAALDSEAQLANELRGRRPKKNSARTPRRFTVWVLAHRFGLPLKSTARKTIGSPGDDYFKKSKRGPIRRT